MSRLDRHVAAVQNKLALGRFVHALAWTSVAYAAAVWIGILVDKLAHVRPPHLVWVLWAGVAACVFASFVWALVRRPTRHEAAVAIDEKLALKEKFSTALFVRPMSDPFAQAAVKDAERTAENVSIHKRFPLEFPRQSMGTVGLGILVALTLAFIPRVNWGKPQADPINKLQLAKIDEAKKSVERALQVVVETEAKGVADEEAIKQARKELELLKAQPIRDPDKTKRSAARALSDLDQALKQQIANNQRVADAENDAKAFKSLMPASDEKGPIADAQRKIAKGDFGDAVDEMKEAVEKFDKMSDQEKKKATEQMQKMAEQLKQMANNPQQQQQMQQQLQQAGLNQQQAQQAQQLMQQAAQGDKQAQQQLQQMAQQALKQMNNGQGPNPQQQQALQQMMKQMQAQCNSQQQAQQMAQAAQQMAQAMKQQQQQAAQNGQKGQPNAQQQAQQMAQAMQQMQQQLGAMQAMKADAQQLAAAQQAAAAGACDAAGACNNPGNNPGQQGQGANWQGNNNGQWKQGDNRQFAGPNNGMGGAGIGAGDRTVKQEAPYGVKQEISQSEDIEGGKILASTLIKAKSVKGESKVGTSNVAAPPEQEATDEVETDRISRPAQQAVKEYFSAWQKDAATK